MYNIYIYVYIWYIAVYKDSSKPIEHGDIPIGRGTLPEVTSAEQQISETSRHGKSFT